MKTTAWTIVSLLLAAPIAAAPSSLSPPSAVFVAATPVSGISAISATQDQPSYPYKGMVDLLRHFVANRKAAGTDASKPIRVVDAELDRGAVVQLTRGPAEEAVLVFFLSGRPRLHPHTARVRTGDGSVFHPAKVDIRSLESSERDEVFAAVLAADDLSSVIAADEVTVELVGFDEVFRGTIGPRDIKKLKAFVEPEGGS